MSDDVERTRRFRIRPLAAGLAGLVILTGGAVAAMTLIHPGAPHQPKPFAIQIASGPSSEPVDESPAPSETPVESLSPAPDATPTAGASRSPTPRPARVPTPTPKPTPRPTPTPTPKPGPVISAQGVSCINRAAHISYSAQARPGTKLSALSVSFDGGTPTSDNVSGRTSFSGSRGNQTTSGRHHYTVSARGTDGGYSSRVYSFNC
jgi:outer membrane biosynthesis protein TonB